MSNEQEARAFMATLRTYFGDPAEATSGPLTDACKDGNPSQLSVDWTDRAAVTNTPPGPFPGGCV